MAENGLQAIVYAPGAEVNSLSVLDQLKLPNAHEYIEVLDTGKAWEVINKMNVSFSISYRQAISSRIYFLRSPPIWVLTRLFGTSGILVLWRIID